MFKEAKAKGSASDGHACPFCRDHQT